jgi:probable rRNA maturation factor
MISKTKKKIPKTAAIQVSNRQRHIRIDSAAVVFFCRALAESLCLSDRSFSVIFVGTAAMRRLNSEWRKKDRATDVLSFAYDGEIIDGLTFLGEIVIAPEIASSRAVKQTEREIRTLIVHGALHLIGYDHETDDGEMIRMQNRVSRRRFFTAAPYITRLTRREED